MSDIGFIRRLRYGGGSGSPLGNNQAIPLFGAPTTWRDERP
jgi:hypothetical protein